MTIFIKSDTVRSFHQMYSSTSSEVSLGGGNPLNAGHTRSYHRKCSIFDAYEIAASMDAVITCTD